ncbi:MAG: YafY family transcriptional regulator [Alphaproteobacteria bacterium]|nr:YafY family transcriptional regulator [Alphaproteobacteria bacterium]MBV9419137.1 YafY family transcriptional regulator [Alphaproteobacteria bacterium]MBV9542368.1 YafY family transcriptional regulator [Alphaproteobacteria bacterium]
MRRAERLFQIIQILRRSKRHPITANAIADELETSLRTVYRDISQLLAERVPIRGEAGMGYILEDGFDMPPLMLTADEIEAAMLGAQWVMGRGDEALARAARDMVAKIGQVVPPHLRPLALDSTLVSPNWRKVMEDTVDMARMRASIHAQTKVSISYSDEQGRETTRTIWPIAVSYWEMVRVIVAWCEMRKAFRSFRTDRVRAADFHTERYPTPRTRLTAQWRKEMREAIERGDHRRRHEAQQART